LAANAAATPAVANAPIEEPTPVEISEVRDAALLEIVMGAPPDKANLLQGLADGLSRTADVPRDPQLVNTNQMLLNMKKDANERSSMLVNIVKSKDARQKNQNK
jgi:hypothetical protein